MAIPPVDTLDTLPNMAAKWMSTMFSQICHSPLALSHRQNATTFDTPLAEITPSLTSSGSSQESSQRPRTRSRYVSQTRSDARGQLQKPYADIDMANRGSQSRYWLCAILPLQYGVIYLFKASIEALEPPFRIAPDPSYALR